MDLGHQPLVRALGFWALTASVINLSIGGSIYVLQGTFAGSLGAAAPLVFLLGAVIFVPIAMCIAAAGSRIASTGGPYAYVRAAFGPLPSFAIGAVFWISNAAGAASLAAALVDQMAAAVPALSPPLTRAAAISGIYLLLWAVNARGIRIGAAIMIALAIIKLAPLVLLSLFGSFSVEPRLLHGASTLSWSALGSAMVLVVFCYSGMELALTPSGEIKDSSRVVPRATFVAITAVVLLAVSLQVVAQGVLGPRLAHNPAPLAAVAEVLLPGTHSLVLFAAGVAMFGILQGDLLGSSRLLYALAQDGHLPSILGFVTSDRRVPLPALTAHTVIVAGIASFGNFASLAPVSGGAMCIVYLGCCSAAWRLQQKDVRESGEPHVLPGGAVIPAATFVALLFILASLEPAEWRAILYAMASIFAVYGINRLRRRRLG